MQQEPVDANEPDSLSCRRSPLPQPPQLGIHVSAPSLFALISPAV
jgi:hypothetical protein